MFPYFEYNLVRCQREAFPRLLPLADLTQQTQTLRELAEIIQPFFNFYYTPWPVYSGFVRKVVRQDGANPLLYVQLWDEGRVVRSVAFRNIGFVGVLNIDYPDDQEPHGYVDVIRAIFYGFNQEAHSIMEGWTEESLALVDGDRLTVPIPWRP